MSQEQTTAAKNKILQEFNNIPSNSPIYDELLQEIKNRNDQSKDKIKTIIININGNHEFRDKNNGVISIPVNEINRFRLENQIFVRLHYGEGMNIGLVMRKFVTALMRSVMFGYKDTNIINESNPNAILFELTKSFDTKIDRID